MTDKTHATAAELLADMLPIGPARSLRDKFAMAALPAITPAALGTVVDHRTSASILNDMAEMAYLLADAMIVARSKGP